MRNKLTFKKRNFWNTGLFTLLQALAVWIAFIVLMLLWLSKVGGVEAAEIEITAGQSHYQQSDNGTWRQNGFLQDFDMDSQSIGLGISDYLSDSVRWHIGYLNLGKVTSYALAVVQDFNYDPGTSGCIGPCLPLAHWYGQGKIEGIYGTLAPEYKYGKWKLFIELGAWLYKPSFSMLVEDAVQCYECAKVHYNLIHKTSYHLGAVYGVGVEYDKTQITLTYYKSDIVGNDPNADIAIYQGYTANLAIRQRF